MMTVKVNIIGKLVKNLAKWHIVPVTSAAKPSCVVRWTHLRSAKTPLVTVDIKSKQAITDSIIAILSYEIPFS